MRVAEKNAKNWFCHRRNQRQKCKKQTETLIDLRLLFVFLVLLRLLDYYSFKIVDYFAFLDVFDPNMQPNYWTKSRTFELFSWPSSTFLLMYYFGLYFMLSLSIFKYLFRFSFVCCACRLDGAWLVSSIVLPPQQQLDGHLCRFFFSLLNSTGRWVGWWRR